MNVKKITFNEIIMTLLQDFSGSDWRQFDGEVLDWWDAWASRSIVSSHFVSTG